MKHFCVKLCDFNLMRSFVAIYMHEIESLGLPKKASLLHDFRGSHVEISCLKE
jgi:hypothetical protein